MTDDDGGREPDIWFRVLLPRGALGPGKMQLMRCIAETGSVSAAARRMRMSHRRSVALVAELNELGFGVLIQTRVGGEAGGGASLTDQGRELLKRYDALAGAIRAAAAGPLGEVMRLAGC